MINIALVLSGGGVKGLAHIGVIKYLEEQGIGITHISGTSAGALVGMMYAAGLTPEAILDYFMNTTILNIRNYGFGKPGFIDVSGYEHELGSLIKVSKFEELQKKFYATATNLFTGEEKVFFEGDLIKPVLASAAFPMVFAPVEIDGSWYADGGIVNNFPVENVPLEVDYIIGVNLNYLSSIDDTTLTSSFAVVERAFNVMMNAKLQAKERICSVFISPEKLSEIGVFEMKKKKLAYDIGYQEAKKKSEALLRLKRPIQE